MNPDDVESLLRPIRTEADYDRAVEALNRLMDAGAGDESHPLSGLLAALGELIGDYEESSGGYDPEGIKVLQRLQVPNELPPPEQWTYDDWLRAVFLADDDPEFRRKYADALAKGRERF